VVAGSCNFEHCAVAEVGERPWPCSSSSSSMPQEQVADTSFDLHRHDTGATSVPAKGGNPACRQGFSVI
jgi:hypothetical protein